LYISSIEGNVGGRREVIYIEFTCHSLSISIIKHTYIHYYVKIKDPETWFRPAVLSSTADAPINLCENANREGEPRWRVSYVSQSENIGDETMIKGDSNCSFEETWAP
jgi:hypothetical protein